MMEMALKVLNNRHVAEEKKEDTKMKRQAALLTVTIHSDQDNSQERRHLRWVTLACTMGQVYRLLLEPNQSVYYKQEGHWKRIFLINPRGGRLETRPVPWRWGQLGLRSPQKASGNKITISPWGISDYLGNWREANEISSGYRNHLLCLNYQKSHPV